MSFIRGPPEGFRYVDMFVDLHLNGTKTLTIKVMVLFTSKQICNVSSFMF